MSSSETISVKIKSKPLEKPAGYEELYRDWVSGKISARGAAKKLGLNHNNFLNWVRRHQQKK